jgi:hypothetical protein
MAKVVFSDKNSRFNRKIYRKRSIPTVFSPFAGMKKFGTRTKTAILASSVTSARGLETFLNVPGVLS